MLFVDGESQVEQLELSVVTIEEIPAGSAVLSGPAHVLAEAVEGRALFGISLWVVAISIADVGFEGGDPVNLVCGLERHRYHRCLRHGGGRRTTRSKFVGQLEKRDAVGDDELGESNQVKSGRGQLEKAAEGAGKDAVFRRMECRQSEAAQSWGGPV